jgi:hypothetical protein
MRTHPRYLPSLFVLTALGCGSGTTPGAVGPDGSGQTPTGGTPPPIGAVPAPTGGGSVQTGIEGIATRSPTRPVCQVSEPCSAPFTSGFEVRQGEQVVARFQSDPAGHFLVALAPGTYTVVPDASAPLLARSQGHEVTVEPSGLTQVSWDFDTGIR